MCEGKKSEQVIKMELKYKIDRYSPSHIMPIMLLLFSSYFIYISLCISVSMVFEHERPELLWYGKRCVFFAPLMLFFQLCEIQERKRDRKIFGVVLFFSLQADCFLPLVQRDL